jgi:acyl-CoA synthetase (NDP forming)
MGGSWGVALTDALEEAGLTVPELSPNLQGRLRSAGLPARASTRNPVDIGASGRYYEVDTMVHMGREILLSGEVDAMVLHGIGSVGIFDENTPPKRRMFVNANSQIIQAFHAMEKETKIPVLIGSHYSRWQSQEILNADKKGIRVYQNLYDLARVLVSMSEFWNMRQSCYS